MPRTGASPNHSNTLPATSHSREQSTSPTRCARRPHRASRINDKPRLSLYETHARVQRVRPASLPTFRHSTIHATRFLHAFAIFGALRNSPSDRNFGGRLSRGLAPTDNNPPRKPAQKLGVKLPTPSAAQEKKGKKNQLPRRAAVCPVLSSDTRLSRPHLFVFALHLPHSSALACSRKCHHACMCISWGSLPDWVVNLLILAPCSAAAAVDSYVIYSVVKRDA